MPDSCQAREQVKSAAQDKAAGAVRAMVARFGGRAVTELRSQLLSWPGYNGVEPEPVAGLEAARELEHAAHALQDDYIRLAREAGRSWYEIGSALDLHWAAVVNKESIADEAYAYALRGDPRAGRRVFTWTCPACRQLISDQGPWPDLPRQEEGHLAGCPRWVAELASWQRHNVSR